MNFSTSSSTFFLLALAAAIFSPNTLPLASAKPQMLRSNKSSSESDDANKPATTSAASSPRFEIPALVSLHSSDTGSLKLLGMDLTTPLTKAETTVLEEALRDVFNLLRDENGSNLITKSVSILQTVVNGNPDGGNKRSLRERKHYYSDEDMCHDSERNIIPGCTYDYNFYREIRCHHCEDDDIDAKEMMKEILPFQPLSASPSSAPSPAPSNTATATERGPNESPANYYNRPSKAEVALCKLLIKSGFKSFQGLKKCQWMKKKFGGN